MSVSVAVLPWRERLRRDGAVPVVREASAGVADGLVDAEDRRDDEQDRRAVRACPAGRTTAALRQRTGTSACCGSPIVLIRST